MVSYFYIVKGSTTTDPDILSHEVKRYKLRIPPFIRVWIGDDCVKKRDPNDPSKSTLVYVDVKYGQKASCITGCTENCLLVSLNSGNSVGTSL